MSLGAIVIAGDTHATREGDSLSVTFAELEEVLEFPLVFGGGLGWSTSSTQHPLVTRADGVVSVALL